MEEKVKTHVLKILKSHFGEPVWFNDKSSSNTAMQGWVKAFGNYSEQRLDRVMDHFLSNYRYKSWPTIADVEESVKATAQTSYDDHGYDVSLKSAIQAASDFIKKIHNRKGKQFVTTTMLTCSLNELASDFEKNNQDLIYKFRDKGDVYTPVRVIYGLMWQKGVLQNGFEKKLEENKMKLQSQSNGSNELGKYVESLMGNKINRNAVR